MFLRDGYLGLNMDKIAEAIEYSKGTIYLHFKSKEDLLSALSGELMANMIEFWERAARFSEKSRKKMLAIIVATDIYFQIHPEHHRTQLLIWGEESIQLKASDENKVKLKERHRKAIDFFTAVIEEGIHSGDLVLSGDTKPDHIMFGIWSLITGAQIMSNEMEQSRQLGQGLMDDLDYRDAHFANAMFLLDGYGWRPLSSEKDYRKIRDDVWNTIFPAESKLLKK